MSLPDLVISGLPSRAPSCLEFSLTLPLSKIGTEGTRKVRAAVAEVGVSLTPTGSTGKPETGVGKRKGKEKERGETAGENVGG